MLDYRYTQKATDTQGGDFVHNGKSPDGIECECGRIRQIISDEGQITYQCRDCGRQWHGEKLEPLKKLDKFELFNDN